MALSNISGFDANTFPWIGEDSPQMNLSTFQLSGITILGHSAAKSLNLSVYATMSEPAMVRSTAHALVYVLRPSDSTLPASSPLDFPSPLRMLLEESMT